MERKKIERQKELCAHKARLTPAVRRALDTAISVAKTINNSLLYSQKTFGLRHCLQPPTPCLGACLAPQHSGGRGGDWEV